MSNSNFNITKVVVDPTSQEITNLEINGKAFESGSEAKLQAGSLTVSENIRGVLFPDEGYDGFSEVSYAINVPSEMPYNLFVKKFIECDDEGTPVTGGHEYNDSITDTAYDEVEASVIYINNTKISVTSKKINVEVPGGKDYSYYIYYWDYEGEWIRMQ